MKQSSEPTTIDDNKPIKLQPEEQDEVPNNEKQNTQDEAPTNEKQNTQDEAPTNEKQNTQDENINLYCNTIEHLLQISKNDAQQSIKLINEIIKHVESTYNIDIITKLDNNKQEIIQNYLNTYQNLSIHSQSISSCILKGRDIQDQDQDNSIPFPTYRNVFTSIHKDTCSSIAFSQDGQLIVSGSRDHTVKLLSVSSIYSTLSSTSGTVSSSTSGTASSSTSGTISSSSGTTTANNNNTNYIKQEQKPVLKIYNDFISPITCTDFHPIETLFITGCEDGRLYIHSHALTGTKHALHTIYDGYSIQSLNIHPSGDYVAVASEHPIPKIYDLETLQGYFTSNPGVDTNDKKNTILPIYNKNNGHHIGPINMIKYNNNGLLYATCSDDGSIKIWDGINNRVIRTIYNAHAQLPVYSVQFAPSSQSLLSYGDDLQARLWDLRTNNCLRIYNTNENNTIRNTYRKIKGCATFIQQYSYILVTEPNTCGINVFNTFDGTFIQNLPRLQTTPIETIAINPIDNSFMICGFNDFRGHQYVSNTVSSSSSIIYPVSI